MKKRLIFPVVFILAMILYDQGRFQLHDHLGKYIPGFANMQILENAIQKNIPIPAILVVQ